MTENISHDAESPWTIDSLLQLMEQRFEQVGDRASLLHDQTELRYQQRFDASQQALSAALLAQKEAVNAALASAERAVAKAEAASEKRFESVNEFRAALGDQTAKLLLRSEADARFDALGDKINVLHSNVGKLELDARSTSLSSVRREDLVPLHDSIDKLRDLSAAQTGKSAAYGAIGAGGIAIMALLIALFSAFYHPNETVLDSKLDNFITQSRQSANAPIGIDSKRVDDLVARIDALSNRLNSTVAPK